MHVVLVMTIQLWNFYYNNQYIFLRKIFFSCIFPLSFVVFLHISYTCLRNATAMRGRQTVSTCFTTFSHDSLNEERLYCNMCLYMFSNYIYFLKKYTLFVMFKYSFYYYCASSFACHKWRYFLSVFRYIILSICTRYVSTTSMETS